MSELSTRDPFEKISRFQTFQSGQYWRANEDIEDTVITKGMVLLIQSIRWVDDSPHTVILRPHPNFIGRNFKVYLNEKKTSYTYETLKEHRFLVDDFLNRFEHEPDHEIIRSKELGEIQGKINELQNELVSTQTNREKFDEIVRAELTDTTTGEKKNLPAISEEISIRTMSSGTIVDVIGNGITEEGVEYLKERADREHKIAVVKSKWIQQKTKEIAETISSMTPYFEEKAAAALAATEDVQSHVMKLKKGIESLDLFLGKNVDVETIREGEPAHESEPLTFVQKKLVMDEELAVYLDIEEWFDFSKHELFFEAIRNHDELVEQIFPTTRCILVMATTRRMIDYGNPFTNENMKEKNRAVFLLVRNGMNIYRVFSPVESHLSASKLFPSQADQDNVFRGVDGTSIKFEDVAFTDRHSIHDDFSLHYKRFLLLVYGLDERLNLFGDFHPGSRMNFMSMEFQNAYCRFIFDDPARTITDKRRPLLREWITEKNSYLRSGSRVLCAWYNIMNQKTAPGACKYNRSRTSEFEFRYHPQNAMEVTIPYKDGQDICADVTVSGYSYSSGKDRTFSCRVDIGKTTKTYGDDLSILCLDAVDIEDVEYYIHNRESRSDFMFYIKFFKTALKHLKEERRVEEKTRRRMANAIIENGMANEKNVDDIVNRSVIAWRAAHRGTNLPNFEEKFDPETWKSILDQMYILSGEGTNRIEDIETFVHSKGYEPLRLVLSGKSKTVVYAAPSNEERDDRIEPHVWVHCITIEKGKRKYMERSRRWTILPAKSASETTLHQWEESTNWVKNDMEYLTTSFKSYSKKQDIFKEIDDADKNMSFFYGETMSPDIWYKEFEKWDESCEIINETTKYVVMPKLYVPIAIVRSKRKDWDNRQTFIAAITCNQPEILLYIKAPNEVCRKKMEEAYSNRFLNKTANWNKFKEKVENFKDKNAWSICGLDINYFEKEKSTKYGDEQKEIYLSGRYSKFDELLQEKMNKLIKEKEIVDIVYGKNIDLKKMDENLGIEHDEDFERLVVKQYRMHVSDDPDLPNVAYDVIPMDAVDHGSVTFTLKDTKYENKAKGVQTMTSQYTSRRDAMAYIEYEKKEQELVHHTKMTDLPSPVDGVDRWYVTKGTRK